MKGVSPVIAVVLLLMVSVGLVGVSFVFFQSSQGAVQNASETELKTQTQQAGIRYQVEGTSQNSVYIRNIGTEPIVNPTFYVNNIPITYTGPASLAAGAIGTYTLDPVLLDTLPNNVNLKIGSGVNVLEEPVTLVVPDTTSPTAAITNPTNGQNVANLATVDVTATDNKGIAYVELYRDSAFLLNDTAAPYQYIWDTTTEANGPHTLYARATDTSRNVASSAVITVNVITPDFTPPTTSITQPVNSQNVLATLTVNATASDLNGVSYVELHKDGVYFANDSTAPYQYTWNTVANTNGAHTLMSRARDPFNNFGTSAVITVTVANPVPDFVIENTNKNTVLLRNNGTAVLTTFAFFVNGASTNYAGPASIAPAAAGLFVLNDSILAMQPDPTTLAVTANSKSRSLLANFYRNYTVAYWKFDEGSGTTTADSSGNGNTATLRDGGGGAPCAGSGSPNCPQWIAGKFGTGVKMDGVQDTIEAPPSQSFNISENLTIQGWINVTSLDPPKINFTQYIQSCGNLLYKWYYNFGPPYVDYAIVLECGNVSGYSPKPFWRPSMRAGHVIAGGQSQAAVSINYTFPPGKWIHVVGTVSRPGNRIAIYANGGNFTSSGTLLANERISYSGVRPFQIGSGPNATFDELRILNVSRSMNLSVTPS